MSKKFTPDWDLLEATQESLREHMALGKALQERVAELEERLNKKAVIGQYLIDANGEGQGALLGSAHWAEKVAEAGLTGQWMELAFVPVK